MGPFYASAEFPNWWRCTVLYSAYFLTIGVEASECGLSVCAVPSILLDQYICSSSLYPPVDVVLQHLVYPQSIFTILLRLKVHVVLIILFTASLTRTLVETVFYGNRGRQTTSCGFPLCEDACNSEED